MKKAGVSLAEIQRHLGARLWMPESLRKDHSYDLEVTRVAPIATAKKGEITFFASEAYSSYLKTTEASVIIVPREMPEVASLQLIHESPYRAFALVAQLFIAQKKPAPGVSSSAEVHPSAQIHETACVMERVSIGEDVIIGQGAVIYPGVYIGRGARIGANTEVRANVVIEYEVIVGAECLIHGGTVLGADGFGFAQSPEGHVKIPQVGTVIVGDHVEIGALCTIDRGALEDTVIGRGTKIDSHVHVGHGVVIGENCLLCAFSGIAGSARLGNWVVTGGHSAINNRCVVADFSQIGAMSALTKSAPKKDTYLGFPAVPAQEWRRQVASGRRNIDLEKRVRHLESLLEKASQTKD